MTGGRCVTEFADPDGDDLGPSLAAAMAHAASGGGGVYYCPNGEWRNTYQIDVPSNTWLGNPSTATLLTSTGAPGGSIRFVDVTGSTIDGLRLRYDGPAGSAPNGVTVSYGSTHINIRKVTATRWAHNFAVFGVETGPASAVTFEDCVSEQAAGFGYVADYAPLVSFYRCAATGSQLDGFKIRKFSPSASIIGGTSSGNGLHPQHAGDGVDVFSGGNAITIRGLSASNNNGNGIVVKTGDTAANGLTGEPEPRRVIIDGVHADNNSGSGVTIHRANGLQGDIPSFTLPDTMALSNVMTEANGSDGVFIRARNVTATNCHATGNAGAGYRVDPAAFDVDMIGCVAYGNDPAGTKANVWIAGQRVTVVGGRAVGYPVNTTVGSVAELAAEPSAARFGYYLTGSSRRCRVVYASAVGHSVKDYHDIGADNVVAE